MKRRAWTKNERGKLLACFKTVPVSNIARDLDRSVRGIYQCASKMGLSTPNRFKVDVMSIYILEHNAAGCSDSEIAALHKVDRHAVSRLRLKLGLPCNAKSDRVRAKVAVNTAKQLRAAGLPSIGHLRVEAFKKRARDAGWPEALRPRAVQILNAMWDRGPMSRREIAKAIGLPWRGSRKSLCSRDAEGTYLANLKTRGLVVVFKRAGTVTGNGKGKSVNIYSLAFDIARRKVAPHDQGK